MNWLSILFWIVILAGGGILIYTLLIKKTPIKIIDKMLILSDSLIASNEDNFFKGWIYQYGYKTLKIYAMSYITIKNKPLYLFNYKRKWLKFFGHPLRPVELLVVSSNKFQRMGHKVYLNDELTLSKFYHISTNPSDDLAQDFIEDFGYKLNNNLIHSGFYAQNMKHTIINTEGVTSGQKETSKTELNKDFIKDNLPI